MGRGSRLRPEDSAHRPQHHPCLVSPVRRDKPPLSVQWPWVRDEVWQGAGAGAFQGLGDSAARVVMSPPSPSWERRLCSRDEEPPGSGCKELPGGPARGPASSCCFSIRRISMFSRSTSTPDAEDYSVSLCRPPLVWVCPGFPGDYTKVVIPPQAELTACSSQHPVGGTGCHFTPLRLRAGWIA